MLNKFKFALSYILFTFERTLINAITDYRKPTLYLSKKY